MKKFERLSRNELKNVLGGDAPLPGKNCFAAIVCSNGGTISGLADCSDESGGSASDGLCDAVYPGTTSSTCDCTNS